MDWITETLAVGNRRDVMEFRELKRQGITGILSLVGLPISIDLPTLSRRRNVEWYRVLLQDGPGNSPQELQAALAALDRLLERNKVLVHCASGVSRAPFVVAAYLAQKRRIPLREALDFVQDRRPIADINTSLYRLWDDYQAMQNHGGAETLSSKDSAPF